MSSLYYCRILDLILDIKKFENFNKKILALLKIVMVYIFYLTSKNAALGCAQTFDTLHQVIKFAEFFEICSYLESAINYNPIFNKSDIKTAVI